MGRANVKQGSPEAGSFQASKKNTNFLKHKPSMGILSSLTDTLPLLMPQKPSETQYSASSCWATPGETTQAGIRQDAGGDGPFTLPLPVSAKNSSPFPPYLDVGDNVHANVSEWLEANCGSDDQKWFIPGVCENGHRIAKVIACGKEWCPVCGKKNSIAHNRRFVRWLIKIQQMSRLSYLVFTIPESSRAKYRTKEALRELGRKAQALLKRHGYSRGLRRWHWFGDKSHKWNAHLNVLVDGGYILAHELALIKQGWADILGVDVVSVRHSYKRRPGEMAGCLNYVTRATFLDYTWDVSVAEELRGFRNMVVWGRNKWDKEPVWELSQVERQAETGETLDIEAIERIVNHECPKCGSHLVWNEAVPGRILDLVDKVFYGGGYYGIIPHPELVHQRGDYRAEWHNQMLELAREKREGERILKEIHLDRQRGKPRCGS